MLGTLLHARVTAALQRLGDCKVLPVPRCGLSLLVLCHEIQTGGKKSSLLIKGVYGTQPYLKNKPEVLQIQGPYLFRCFKSSWGHVTILNY